MHLEIEQTKELYTDINKFKGNNSDLNNLNIKRDLEITSSFIKKKVIISTTMEALVKYLKKKFLQIFFKTPFHIYFFLTLNLFLITIFDVLHILFKKNLELC